MSLVELSTLNQFISVYRTRTPNKVKYYTNPERVFSYIHFNRRYSVFNCLFLFYSFSGLEENQYEAIKCATHTNIWLELASLLPVHSNDSPILSQHHYLLTSVWNTFTSQSSSFKLFVNFPFLSSKINTDCSSCHY